MTETAVELLDRDHAGISELFDRVHSPDEDRAGVLRVLIERLAAHVAVEHAVVLDALVKFAPKDSSLEKDLRNDYHDLGHNLVLIERRKANSPDMPGLVTEMHDVFRAHVERCQEKLYPNLERILDDAQLNDLADRLSAADDLVLTHPHPHLLSLGPVSRLTTRIAAALERLRGGFEWGGLTATENDNSNARRETPDPVEGSIEPPPWRDPADG